MAEDEAPRHRGGPHEIQRQERVERGEPGRRRQLSDRRREVRLERLAGDGGGVEQRALLPRQRRELLGERRCDRGRNSRARSVAARRRGTPRLLARARELLEIERVAATVAVDGGDRSRLEIAQQFAGLILAELAEPDPAR